MYFLINIWNANDVPIVHGMQPMSYKMNLFPIWVNAPKDKFEFS
jgi:hypothetical protein